MPNRSNPEVLRNDPALEYHEREPAGKIEVVATKPCATQVDLSLAYTPGVALPCLEIAKNPDAAALYTGRANLVAVISNGSAVLGLGDIGPLASKPVMEGKAVLFKRFAGIDVFDLELDCEDPDKLVEIVKALEPTFGGINLEDIKAPECFYIEKRLREEMQIPVFHDDQHGTAIITCAAFINALELAGKEAKDAKVVVSGAGAAAVACGNLLVSFGVQEHNLVYCDSRGVIFKGRENLSAEKEALAVETKARSLADAMVGSDVFLGVSVKDLVSPQMVQSMNSNPIIFALANPDPEISYPDAKAAREDAIVATGRSDFPNQVNNVLGFPYIFRGALDSGASVVTEEMKMAAARALAALAREDVPDSVRSAYGGKEIRFGSDYLIPKPFDHRVLLWVAPAVAQAANKSGVAHRPITDMAAYRKKLSVFLGKRREVMAHVGTKARLDPKKIVFPEGYKRRTLRACYELAQEGICHPVVLGDKQRIETVARGAGITLDKIEIIDPYGSEYYESFVNKYIELRHRKGITPRAARKHMSERVRFGMMMVRQNLAGGLVCGLSMNYPETIRPALQIIGAQSNVVAGMYLILKKDRMFFFADTTVNIEPDAQTLASIAILTAKEVEKFNVQPRVAMVSFSSFGSANHSLVSKVQEAAGIVRRLEPDLIIDGEMQIDPAVNPHLAAEEYPFSKIQGDANILIFPSLEAANVAYKLMANVGDSEAVGPILLGMEQPVNVLSRGASAEDVYNMAAYTVLQAQSK